MKQTGKVWLAGAGPGDAGLLTVKTRRLLEQADVVVYDALISAEILSLIPPETIRINVGKRAGCHLVPQEETNRILVEQARFGRKVLRLKGGDPFIFGRGGEELELLVQAGISFEIVPGITSASAVPAYAGIPVTHRDYTSSFHVITGHSGNGIEPRIPYEALTELNGTLIFLMGMGALERICSGLMAAGMDKDMPAAVIEKGTTARQRCVVSTIECLKTEADNAGIQTPAVIMVGKVCALSEAFHWTDNRPLNGRQVLVTRPKQLVSAMAGRLRDQGAMVIELPSIHTEPITPNDRLKEELLYIQEREEIWFAFTSPTGVEVFFDQLRELRLDIRAVFQRSVKIAVIGSATGNALEQRGLFADLMPDTYCAEALGKALACTMGEQAHIAVFRAEEGSELLLPPIAGRGISHSDIPLYKTVLRADQELKEMVSGMFERKEIDWVTFTSASTVRGFVSIFDGMDYRNVYGICIGEQTRQEAEKYGIKTAVSKQASIDSMIELMTAFSRGKNQDEKVHREKNSDGAPDHFCIDNDYIFSDKNDAGKSLSEQ